MTALHIAVLKGRTEAARLLVEAGARTDVGNKVNLVQDIINTLFISYLLAIFIVLLLFF